MRPLPVTTITATDKLACCERELAFRNRVYARLVARGKMTATEQDRELALMLEIVNDYRAAVAADAPELNLFIETRRTVKEGRP